MLPLERSQVAARLEFVAQDLPGFWERAGIKNDADIWLEERTPDRPEVLEK
jgi:DMSO/TMAO reductase YedYZ molybdopterin-dependent catalytic subunit